MAKESDIERRERLIKELREGKPMGPGQRRTTSAGAPAEHALLKSFGGSLERSRIAGGLSDETPGEAWNFGVKPKTKMVAESIAAKPSLWDRFPALKGKWDRKSTINHWDAIRKAAGTQGFNPEDLIQLQPRGTCGGRAGSFCIDAVQCIMIAAGARAKFHRASHAGVYYLARKLFNEIGGNWKDENNDGVASGSVPDALAKFGVVTREEDNDSSWYGEGSDDLACQLAAGMHPDVAANILKLASDNVITEWAPVYSFEEMADGIAAGGVAVGSDSQGFTMQRNAQGFCRPQGRWDHYQVRISVGVWGGIAGCGYNQSWGKTTPAGPLLPGHPGNCFGVEGSVQDRIIKSGDWAVVFGFPLWDLENNKVNVDWSFA
jgi:hypothetical protein